MLKLFTYTHYNHYVSISCPEISKEIIEMQCNKFWKVLQKNVFEREYILHLLDTQAACKRKQLSYIYFILQLWNNTEL